MGWKDVRVGSGQYITLKGDGEKATVVFLGEPYEQTMAGAGGKQRRRYLFNVGTPEALAKGKALVFPAGPTTADKLRKVLNDGELAGKVSVTVTRRGASGDRDTKYDVSAPKKLSPAEQKKYAGLELVDLAAEPLPSGGKY